MHRLFSSLAALILTTTLYGIGTANTEQTNLEPSSPREIFAQKYEETFKEKPSDETWKRSGKCCCGNGG